MKILPTPAARKTDIRRRLRNQNRMHMKLVKFRGLRDGAPQRIFDKQRARFGMRQELQMLGGGKFVIERHNHAARKKHGVGRNQPLGLIRHDDGGAVSGGKS